MRNLIINPTATGVWQEMPTVPNRTRVVAMQARSSDDMYYRFRGQTTYWTIKADSFHSIVGEFWQGDLEMNAANGVVLEIQYSTQLAV